MASWPFLFKCMAPWNLGCPGGLMCLPIPLVLCWACTTRGFISDAEACSSNSRGMLLLNLLRPFALHLQPALWCYGVLAIHFQERHPLFSVQVPKWRVQEIAIYSKTVCVAGIARTWPAGYQILWRCLPHSVNCSIARRTNMLCQKQQLFQKV